MAFLRDADTPKAVSEIETSNTERPERARRVGDIEGFWTSVAERHAYIGFWHERATAEAVDR